MFCKTVRIKNLPTLPTMQDRVRLRKIRRRIPDILSRGQ